MGYSIAGSGIVTVLYAIVFFCLVCGPAFGDGATNGGSSEGTVSATISGAAICSSTICTVDNEVITPTLVSAEDGIVYVY